MCTRPICSTLSILAASLETVRDRAAQPAAHRNPGGAGVLRAGADRLVRHAAQAQPVELRDDSGLARVVRGYLIPAMLENIATWHERDLSNSSVERIILPDASILVDWMLWKLTDILEHLANRVSREHEAQHGEVRRPGVQ
jgi:adenylosuccinate lyase